jgi:aryl-alcohol dehydrogenase-like predicted oxidoreductase
MVSTLCMGTMSFGGTADKQESTAMYRSCRNAGVNFFDCSNNYCGGLSEEILGDLIRSERDEVIITSKFGFRTSPHVNDVGSSRLNAIKEVERSLKRMGTDRIDVYFVHGFDPYTAPEEILRALDDLVRTGKIIYIGVSNWAAWQIMKALGLSDHYGWNRIACIQPMYNLVKRQAEVEILPLAQAENLAVMTYSPLAGGLLTHKYNYEESPEKGRFAEMPRYQVRYDRKEIYEAAHAFIDLSNSRGIDPATLAVAWVASHPAITSPIIGARNNEQLKASLAAADISLEPELRGQIDALFCAPPPATDRSEDTRKGFGLRD